MSKRLQVLIPESDFRNFRRLAGAKGLTVAGWVRQALRRASRQEAGGSPAERLAAIREAAIHRFPAPPVEQMLKEIERGYLESVVPGIVRLS